MATDNLSLILGGMGAAGQGLASAAERPENKQLSGFQKYIAQILAGKMSPKQAAIAARLEAQGVQLDAPGAPSQAAPEPAPTPQPGPWLGGYGSGNPRPQGQPAPLPAPAPASAAASEPAAPVGPDHPMPEPQTQADLEFLLKVAPYFQDRNMTFEQRLFLEAIKNQTRRDIQDEKSKNNLEVAQTYTGTRQAEGQANRTQQANQFAETMRFKRQQHSDMMRLAREKLKSLNDRTKSAQDKAYDLEIIKGMRQQMIAAMRDAAYIQGGINASDPNAQAMVAELQQGITELDAMIAEREAAIEQERKLGPDRNNPAGAPEWAKPTSKGSKKAPSVNDLLKSSGK